MSSTISIHLALPTLAALQWWFLQGHSVPAAECDLVPSPRPPPTWAAICSSISSSCVFIESSLFTTLLLRLQWWFTKGRYFAPAAEPRASPSSRPPSSWGSSTATSSLRRLVYLALVLPSSALSPDSSIASHHLPCPVSLSVLLVLFLPWLILHLQPFFRSKWPVAHRFVLEIITSLGPVATCLY